jgi:hypothetical protein
MLKLKPYSSAALAFAGFLLMLMGLYFMFIRPALLPEDFLFIQASLFKIENSLPRLVPWIQKVFWVLGGYVFATGLLTLFISQTSFRIRTQGAFSVAALAGTSSIASMTIVNFMIDSNFKWLLLIFSMPWMIALMLYQLHK